MNNILSIDLDILFSPGLGLCHDFPDKMPREIFWENVYKDFDKEFFNYNKEYYNALKKIVEHYTNKVEKIYIGKDHSSIIEALDLEKKHFLNYSFDIYNIDFHHDIGYSINDEEEVVHNFVCNCGNWVGLLNHSGYINKYSWYYGYGSVYKTNVLDDNRNPLTPRNMNKKEFSNSFPENLDLKMLYITYSPLWIPLGQENIIKEIISLIPKEKRVYLNEAYYSISTRKNFLNHNFYDDIIFE